MPLGGEEHIMEIIDILTAAAEAKASDISPKAVFILDTLIK